MALSPIGRLSFPALYVPKSMNEKDTKKYQATLIFDMEALEGEQRELFNAMWKAANTANLEKFKCKLGTKPNLKDPFRKGEEKEFDGYGEGKIFVKFSSERTPQIVGSKKDRNGKAIHISEADGRREIYAGMDCRVSYSVYHFDNSGNKGVAFGLGNLQKTGDNDAFGAGTTDANDDFDFSESSSDDELADMLDDVPF